MQEEVIKEDIDLVSLASVKKHLRIEPDYTDDDELIKDYIDSACEQIADFIERPLSLQTTVYTSDKMQDFTFERKAVNDVVEKIEYKVSEEAEFVLLPSESYKILKVSDELIQVHYREVPAGVIEVKVYVKQGYDQSSIPKVFKQAVFLIVADAYERRENGPAVVVTKAKSLIKSYRKWRI